MTSGQRTIRMPSPADLYAEPPLGPLLLLELAAAVTANALCAHHVVVEYGFCPGETDEIAAARSLVNACNQLVQLLDDYRGRVLARLAREGNQWPF